MPIIMFPRKWAYTPRAVILPEDQLALFMYTYIHVYMLSPCIVCRNAKRRLPSARRYGCARQSYGPSTLSRTSAGGFWERSRRRPSLTFHMTKALMLHGSFQNYLHRMDRAASTRCYHFHTEADTVEHTMFERQYLSWMREMLDRTAATCQPLWTFIQYCMAWILKENMALLRDAEESFRLLKMVENILTAKDGEERIKQVPERRWSDFSGKRLSSARSKLHTASHCCFVSCSVPIDRKHIISREFVRGSTFWGFVVPGLAVPYYNCK